MVDKIKKFMEEVLVELKKVIWPTREQLINSTFVVFVVSALFTVFTFLADYIFSSFIKLLY